MIHTVQQVEIENEITKIVATTHMRPRARAKLILEVLQSHGWESPEGCKQCTQRQIDSEKMLNREAAFDEKQLRDEVKYWKDKTYSLGG